MSKLYRKRPVVIEAIRYTAGTYSDVLAFIYKCAPEIKEIEDDLIEGIKIPTLEGDMYLKEGDYLIKGVKGEIYPCKPDVFEMTYEQL